MKKTKIITLALLNLMALTGCGATTSNPSGGQPTTPVPPTSSVTKTDLEKLNEVKETLLKGVDLTAVTSDLTLPTTIEGGFEVEWDSSNFRVINAQGKVTRPAEDAEGDVEVTLTATITLNNDSVTKTFTVKVLKKVSSSYKSIAELFEKATVGQDVVMTGVVVSSYKDGRIITDGVNNLAVFFSNYKGETAISEFSIGTEIKITGKYSLYQTLYQISDVANCEVISRNRLAKQNYKNLTVEEVLKLDPTADKTVSGKALRIEGKIIKQKSGDFTDWYIESGDKKIMIYYKSTDASKNYVGTFENKSVIIECNYYSNDSAKNGVQIVYDLDSQSIVEGTINYSNLLDAYKLGAGSYNIIGEVASMVDAYGGKNKTVVISDANDMTGTLTIPVANAATLEVGKSYIFKNIAISQSTKELTIAADYKIKPYQINASQTFTEDSFVEIPSFSSSNITLSALEYYNNLMYLQGAAVFVSDLVITNIANDFANKNQNIICEKDGIKLAVSYAKELYGIQDVLKVGDKYTRKVYYNGLVTIGDSAYLKGNSSLYLSSNDERVTFAKKWLNISKQTSVDLTLPTTGLYDSAITWKSLNPELINDNGQIVGTLTDYKQIQMEATIKLQSSEVKKVFDVELIPTSKLTGTELFMSEVRIEAQTNKIIEISNPTDHEIDLTGYQIQGKKAGNFSACAKLFDLKVEGKTTIAPGETITYTDLTADVELQTLGAINLSAGFKNDWKLQLVKIEGDVVTPIDRIGIDNPATYLLEGVDSGKGSMIRKPGVFGSVEYKNSDWTITEIGTEANPFGNYELLRKHTF